MAHIHRWYILFRALGSLNKLEKIDLWIDIGEERAIIEMGRNITLYEFPPAVAAILTLDLPASERSALYRITAPEADGEDHRPAFRVRRRGYSRYYVNREGQFAERDEDGDVFGEGERYSGLSDRSNRLRARGARGGIPQ